MTPCPMCTGSYGAHAFRCPLYAQAAPVPANPTREALAVRVIPASPSTNTDPLYYKAMNPEPITVITAWGLGFNLGNVVKYVARAGRKPGQSAASDLAKAADYLAREIARHQGSDK